MTWNRCIKLACHPVLYLASALLAVSPPLTAAENPRTGVSLPGGIEYDVRSLQNRLPPTPATAAAKAAAADLVDSRKALASAYLETGPSSLREAQVSWNEYGQPKMLFHPELALTDPSSDDAERIARNFLDQHRPLFSLGANDLAQIRLGHRREIPGGTVLFFEQTVGGVPLHQAQLQFVVNLGGEVLQAGAGGLIPDLNVVTAPAIDAETAVRKALESVGLPLAAALKPTTSSISGQVAFENPAGAERQPVTAGLILLPFSPTDARLAWRVSLDLDSGRWYDAFIDANDGATLRRLNLYQKVAKGRVWPESPDAGPRELITFPDNWATLTSTIGNNVDAYLDRDGNDLPDASPLPDISRGRAFSPSMSFDFPAGQGTTGEDPRQFPAAAVTNLYFFVNRAHDYFYTLGFTEAAGNFQTSNLGKGGRALDPVLAEAQDTFRDNASFATPPDGVAPRMQMGIFSGADVGSRNDDLDSSLDGTIVFHEYSHGVTNRLVGGPAAVDCLRGGQSSALGEGWSDYLAASYFNNPVSGAYSVQNPSRGIRRFNLDQSPLAYSDMGNESFEVHNDGEIWAATLWELRKTLGKAIVDSLVIEALPLTPCNPSYVNARDAIIQADRMKNAGANVSRLWTIFARRGLGFSAQGFDGDPLNDRHNFVASFDLPPTQAPSNHHPQVISFAPNRLYLNSDPFSYQINVSDEDGDKITFELLDGPSGMSLTPGGRVGWNVNAFTDQRVVVMISDGRGGRLVHGFSILIVTLHNTNRPLVINGRQGSLGFVFVPIFEGARAFQFRLRRGTGDPDLQLFGPGLTAASERTGVSETLTIPQPIGNALYLALITAFEGYSGVEFSADAPRATSLAPDIVLTGQRREAVSENYFRFDVPTGVDSFTISTGGGAGDVDLYLSREEFPACQPSRFVSAPCRFEHRSATPGTNFETITVNGAAGAALSFEDAVSVPAAAGTYYLDLYTASELTNLSVSLTFNRGAVAAPAIGAAGVVNGASFTPLLSPGAIGSVFGVGLSSVTASAASVPLPTTLGNAQVLVNGVPAPLFFVSPAQINFQAPFEAAPSGAATVVVRRANTPSNIQPMNLAAFAPGVFTYLVAGGFDPVIVHADGRLVTAAAPAVAGETVVAYGSGLGSVTNPPRTGSPAVVAPFSLATETPNVTVGGRPAVVHFAGLTAGFVGLAQFNIQLPNALPPGATLPLVISFTTGESLPATLYVR